MFRSRSLAYSILLSASCLTATAALAAQTPLESKARQFSVIAADLQAKGTSRVIVKFKVAPSSLRTQSAIAARKSEVRAGQDAILNAAFGSPAAAGHALTRMRIEPMFALSASKAELDRLAADPRVTAIYHDNLSRPSLIQSVPLIGADKLQKVGGTGEGFIVTIIDTGVERTHDFLKGRVVTGACYGTDDEGFTSTCKGGVNEDEGKKAGDPCTQSSSCFHGTHVAGIAAGKLKHKKDHPGEPKVGVAPKASIIAINVFSFSAVDGLGAFDSDIERGLEFALEHRTSFEGLTVASANMSLGDGTNHTSDCDEEDVLTDVVNDLKEANVATVISAGNDASRDGVGAPGCISSAITVGATTKTDLIASFSNMSELVDVLAPGSGIRSSILNNQFGGASGTSMSAPHVTGSWAALRSLHPDASVDDIEAALESTGVAIHDQRAGGTVTKPRIQIDDAHDALSD